MREKFYKNFIDSIFENQSIFDLCGILADIECFNLYRFKKETSNDSLCKRISKIFNNHPVLNETDTIARCKLFFENIFIKYIDNLKVNNIDVNILFEENLDEIEDEHIKAINRLLRELKYSKEDLINYYTEE